MTITIDIGWLLIFVGLVCWSIVGYYYILRPFVIRFYKNRVGDEYEKNYEEDNDGQEQA